MKNFKNTFVTMGALMGGVLLLNGMCAYAHADVDCSKMDASTVSSTKQIHDDSTDSSDSSSGHKSRSHSAGGGPDGGFGGGPQGGPSGGPNN